MILREWEVNRSTAKPIAAHCYGWPASFRRGINAAGADDDNIGVDPKAPLARCDDCPLEDRPRVTGCGPRIADRIILGEAPGETETVEGKPFVGSGPSARRRTFSQGGEPGHHLHHECGYLSSSRERIPSPPREAISACHERLIGEVQQRFR